LDSNELARVKAGLATEMQAIREGKQDTLGIDSDYISSTPECGRFRLYRVDQRVPETHVFRDHLMLIDLVDAYMRGNLSTLELALEMRRPPLDWDRALGDLIPHTAHVIRELKIYLALDDITDDNGPIIYWTGTHRTGEWRRLLDYLASIGGIWAESSNILNQTTVANLMKRSRNSRDVARCAAPSRREARSRVIREACIGRRISIVASVDTFIRPMA